MANSLRSLISATTPSTAPLATQPDDAPPALRALVAATEQRMDAATAAVLQESDEPTLTHPPPDIRADLNALALDHDFDQLYGNMEQRKHQVHRIHTTLLAQQHQLDTLCNNLMIKSKNYRETINEITEAGNAELHSFSCSIQNTQINAEREHKEHLRAMDTSAILQAETEFSTNLPDITSGHVTTILEQLMERQRTLLDELEDMYQTKHSDMIQELDSLDSKITGALQEGL